MNISIIGRKVKITPVIRRYIEKKMKKIDHLADHIYDFKIILKRERHFYFAEVNITFKRKIIHIFAKTNDIHSVIDMLFDKIEIKLKRYWDKVIDKRGVSIKEKVEGEVPPASAIAQQETVPQEI